MSTVQVTKDSQNKLVGFGEAGERSYARFLAAVKRLEPGELLAFSFKVPRSPKFHRLHFAMLNAFFQAQEQFSDMEQMRKWLEVGAGHCDYVPGPAGRMVALPRSIAYDALDDAGFAEVHEAVKRFLRGRHAQVFLWAHLDESKAAEMVETLLREFEEF
jgi:hypothetical protein